MSLITFQMKSITFLFFVFISFCEPIFSQNLDVEVLKSINLDRNRNLDASFGLLSEATLPIAIGTPTLIAGIGLLKKDSKTTKKGLLIATSLASTVLLTAGAKQIFDRPRPYITYPFLDNQTTEKDLSFPSGHTSTAFTIATSLTLAYPKWYVILPSYTWATLTGYSRLHLGVHYPSDVLAGAIVGSGCALLTHYLNKKMRKVKNRKN